MGRKGRVGTSLISKPVSLGNFCLEVGQHPSSGGQADDPEAQFPSHVAIRSSSLEMAYVRALQISEAPLTAGPLAAVPCISGSKRNQGRWSS